MINIRFNILCAFSWNKKKKLTGKTKFLPVHMHYIHVMYSHSLLHAVSFLLFVQHQFCFLSQVFSFAFNIVCEVPKFFCSVAFLTVRIFLSVISSSVCDHLLFRCSSLDFGVSGLFNNRWRSLSSPRHASNKILISDGVNYTYPKKLGQAYVVLVHRAATRWHTCPA